MKIERLKKSHKKQVVIGAIAVCVVGGALTFATTRAKYKLTESIPLVRGTVNYKAYDFKVMAMYKSEDGTNYTEIEDMPSSGYIINEEKTYCTTDNKTQVKGKIKTENGKHYIIGLTKSDKCYLYFDKARPITIPDIIAGLNAKAKSPTFSNTATTDEGVYSVSDGMYGGTSYYWRGVTTTNYVKFANKCWRIIRINGDKTMRLIYDGATCHENGASTADSIVTSQVYNSAYIQSNYVGWTYEGTIQRTLGGTDSNAKSQTESWYNTNLASYASKIADGKYCNDRSVQSGSTWAINGSEFYYAAYKRIYTDYSPTLSCPLGDIYTLKVGAITADEVMYAGGTSSSNASYYLYNGYNYWTMSPSYWHGGGSGYNPHACVFRVGSYGALSDEWVSRYNAFRPVINLKADTKFEIGGSGTQSNPYVVN